MTAKMRRIYSERAESRGAKNCSLCYGELDVEKNKRGVVEFFDGWFWICGNCARKVGRRFDVTKSSDYGQGKVVPYFKRSRRYFLKWLEDEYQIKIA